MTRITNEFSDKQEKWLKLLESGEHQQTEGSLVRQQWKEDMSGFECSYCCLGIAGRFVLGVEPDFGRDATTTGTMNGAKTFLWDGADYDLKLHSLEGGFMWHPEDVEDSYAEGLEYHDDVEDERIESLAAMNDTKDWTFEKIAAFIRKHPWAVFTNFESPARNDLHPDFDFM